MTKNQIQKIQKRNERSQNLKVFKVSDDQFYVESSEGKICYRVSFSDDGHECTCGDFSRNSKNDHEFKCKHILAVWNAIPNGEVETAIILKKKMPKLDERFIMTIEGKEFVKYSGLLDLGTQKGISSIDVEIVQLPTKDNGNFAVCRAHVIAKNGDSFTDIGDANPLNCNSKVAKHLLRMASTRSIARALRSYTNIGMTCLEELGDLDEAIGDNGSRNRKLPVKAIADDPKPMIIESKQAPTESEIKPEAPADQNVKPQPSKPRRIDSKRAAVKPESNTEQKPANGNSKNNASQEEPPTMSTAQKNAIFNLSRRRGISVADLEKMAQDTYGVSVEKLTPQGASAFIRQLQSAA